MKRVGVLGTLVWDRIFPADGGEVREQWGGLTYSLSAFAAASPPGWRAVPLVKVGSDLIGAAHELLESLPNLAPGGGVRAVAQPNNRVDLHYRDAVTREEVMRGGVPGWRWDELAPLVSGLDALYVNFLSGFELDLATARELRSHYAGPIYADLHSLFLGPPREGARQPRPLADAAEWLACFDMVQLNEAEAALLRTSEGRDPSSEPAAADPLALAVTLAGEGVRCSVAEGVPPDPLAWPSLRSRVHARPAPRERIELRHDPHAGDPTGCGDVWGASCFAGLLGGFGWNESLRRAHSLAAAKLQCRSTAELAGWLERVA